MILNFTDYKKKDTLNVSICSIHYLLLRKNFNMLNRLPLFITIPLFFITTMQVWKGYHYFFDKNNPEITIIGIENNGYYKGDLACIIEGKDTYKVQSMKIMLDGKLFSSSYHKINKSKFQYPIKFALLNDGAHTLSIELEKSSYKERKSVKEIVFFIDNKPLLADFTKNEYKVFQGRTLHLQFHVNKPIAKAEISVLSHTYTCIQENDASSIYECFIPVPWDTQSNEYPFFIIIQDLTGNELRLDSKLQVIPFPFLKQSIHVDSKKIATEAEIGMKHQELEKALDELTKKSPAKKLWHGLFYVPLELKKITTEYGTMRVTQDRGIRSHTALDLVGRPKGGIWASQDGIIVLKERYALSGNTIVIDHGYGILSLYYHLDSFASVSVGDSIKKGLPIGTEGMTGYANGYHLHWEIRVNNIPVDPMQWTKNDF